MFSALILGASLAGRWYAPKINVTRIPFTFSALCKYIITINLFIYCFSYQWYLSSIYSPLITKKRDLLTAVRLEELLIKISNSTQLQEEHSIEPRLLDKLKSVENNEAIN